MRSSRLGWARCLPLLRSNRIYRKSMRWITRKPTRSRPTRQSATASDGVTYR